MPWCTSHRCRCSSAIPMAPINELTTEQSHGRLPGGPPPQRLAHAAARALSVWSIPSSRTSPARRGSTHSRAFPDGWERPAAHTVRFWHAPFVSLSILFIAAALLGSQVLRTRRPSARRSRPPALLVALLVVGRRLLVRHPEGGCRGPGGVDAIWSPLWILVAIVVFDRVEERPRFLWLFIGALFLHNLLGHAPHAQHLRGLSRSEGLLARCPCPFGRRHPHSRRSMSPRYLAYQSAGRVISLSRVDTLADMESTTNSHSRRLEMST